MSRPAVCTLFLLVIVTLVLGRQRKENDFDVNYDESRLPSYQLPALLGRRSCPSLPISFTAAFPAPAIQCSQTSK